MKKAIVGTIAMLLLLVLVTVACGGGGNKLPAAYLDSISPEGAVKGEAVTFTGHGTDADGGVTGWEWTSSIDGVVGTTASFTTTALSSGTHTIKFRVQDNNGAWSNEVSQQLVIQAPVGMDEAIAVVVDEILPTIAEVQAGEPYWCLRLGAPLSTGTVIEEDSGSTLRITLDETIFFFYLDLAPGSYYEHPVKYILVDDDGNHDEFDASWWPRIDDVVPAGLVQELPAAADVIATNVDLTPAQGSVPQYSFAAPDTGDAEGFILVQGLMPDEANYDDAVDSYQNAVNFFNAYTSAQSTVEGLVQSEASRLMETIDDMVDDGKDVITVYIVSHGGANYVRLGGEKFLASEFRECTEDYPDVIFSFILASPHSATFIDDLTVIDEVYLEKNVHVVETACASGEWPKADLDAWGTRDDANPADAGSEWTSSLFEAMLMAIEDEPTMDYLWGVAESNLVPETTIFVWNAGRGAVGAQPVIAMTVDYDLSHYLGWTSPAHYSFVESRQQPAE